MTTKNTVSRIVTVALLGSFVAACGGGGGLPKGPNEFEVVGRAPLVIPPESDLRPPRPGEPRPQEIDPTNRAIRALFPEGATTPPPASDGEQKLLSKLGTGSNADVRSLGQKKDQEVVRKTLVLADLLAMEEREFEPDNVSVTRTSGN